MTQNIIVKHVEQFERTITQINVNTLLDVLVIFCTFSFAILAKTFNENFKGNIVSFKKILSTPKDNRSELESSILTTEYIKRLDQILAQIAILGKYDRVILGIFHNGVVGSRHSKFEKIAIISSYTVSGVEEAPELGKDLSMESIYQEMSLLRNTDRKYEVDIKHLDQYTSNCYIFLKNRNIQKMQNYLLERNGLDLGILSCHYCYSNNETISEESEKVINDLRVEIASIIDVYANVNRISKN